MPQERNAEGDEPIAFVRGRLLNSGFYSLLDGRDVRVLVTDGFLEELARKLAYGNPVDECRGAKEYVAVWFQPDVELTLVRHNDRSVRATSYDVALHLKA